MFQREKKLCLNKTDMRAKEAKYSKNAVKFLAQYEYVNVRNKKMNILPLLFRFCYTVKEVYGVVYI